MRRLVLGISIILMLNFNLLHSVETSRNSSVPTDKNPGKTIVLEEILKIADDDTERFFLKYPYIIQISNDDSIFVVDGKQLLKFDSEGRFIRNFYKYGQGPGETISVPQFVLKDRTIVIHDSAVNKFIFVDHESGKMIKEFRLDKTTHDELLFCNDKEFYLIRTQPFDSQGKLKLINIDISLISVSLKPDYAQKILINFPTRFLILRAGSKFNISRRAKFLTCIASNGLMYISHTPEYQLKQFDLKENTLIRNISRDYKRVKVTEETKKYAPGGNTRRISIDGKQWFDVPVDKYHLDIQKIFSYNDKIWVVTSTIYDDSKILVDVFNSQGKYVSNFYFHCPSSAIPYKIGLWLKAIKGNFLYTVEEDGNGQMCIKKYRLKEFK